LAGRVSDPNGAGLDKVLVERLGCGWGKRLEATFTNPHGHFSFRSRLKGMQYLRLSKPGFNTALIRVQLRKKNAPPNLDVNLSLSH
jgi:hypothetical protein